MLMDVSPARPSPMAPAPTIGRPKGHQRTTTRVHFGDPRFPKLLPKRSKDHYGNTVMHYFALRENDDALAALLRVGGCMCIHNKAGQSATDDRTCVAPRSFACSMEVVPYAVCVFKPSDVPTMRIESIGATAPSALCEECDVA